MEIICFIFLEGSSVVVLCLVVVVRCLSGTKTGKVLEDNVLIFIFTGVVGLVTTLLAVSFSQLALALIVSGTCFEK